MTRATYISVIDDDPGMRQSIGRILDLRGFKARSFASAEQFLLDENAANSGCLVVDINLGGMSGIDLYRHLRASGTQIPVIFITASEDSHIQSEAAETGCVAVLHKPFTANALFAAIFEARLAHAPLRRVQ